MSFFSYRTLDGDSQILKVVVERGASQLPATQVTVTTTSAQLIPAKAGRRSISIKNLSAQNVYIKGTSPATTSDYPIAASAEKVFEDYKGAIYAMVSATTADVRIIEELI